MPCLAKWIQRRWPFTGTLPCIWAIPTAHTQIEAGPDTRKDPPPPRPQHSLTCGYHAIQGILSRVGLSPELAYPLPTTDQGVHQIHMLVCAILAAAGEDGKLLLQTARPTTDQASAQLQADTYTDTTIPPAQSPPMPLPPRFPCGGPHTPTNARIPGLPPAHTRENPGPAPPTPECSPGELFPPADANPHNPTHCGTPAQPSPEGEDRSPAPRSPAAADHIGPPGRQVTAGPPEPPSPYLQPEDMPSILSALAAAEAAAKRPATARITAQPASPKTTTSSSSTSSSTSSASFSNPPLPADLIHKATVKAKAAAASQATRGPPTPTQATQAPRPQTRKPSTRHRRPRTCGTEVLLNLKPDPNPKPDPKPKPAPKRSHHQQRHYHQHHPTQPPTPQTQRRQPKRQRPNPNPNPNQDPPSTTTEVPLPPAAAATTEAATQQDPVQTLVNIPISKRLVIHPPQTITAAGQTDPGTWDPSTSVTVKPGPRPAPATRQTVRPQGLRTMPDPPPPPGGPEYPQGVLGPYPQYHPHHYQHHHHERPHHQHHNHHQHHPDH